MINYIRQYWNAMETGDIVVSRRIKQQYQKLINDLDNPRDPYIFDIKRATEPIDFIETICKQSKGKNAGKPLKLMLFQKAKIQAMFGFIHKDTGFRQYNEVMTIEGRKNGKSTEQAAVGLYMATVDDEAGAEIYTAATKLDQAKIVFDEMHSMVGMDYGLSRRFKKKQGALLQWDRKNSKIIIKALAKSSRSLDGLNAHYIIIDELAAIKDRNMYDVLYQSMSARDQPMISSISTNGMERDNIFDHKYDQACKLLDAKPGDPHESRKFLAFLYELDDIKEWDDPDMWIKANPGLGVIKKKSFISDQVRNVATDPNSKETLLAKDFNMKVTGVSSWLPYDTIENKETFDIGKMGFRYAIGGIDMSQTTDLTAAVLLMRRPNDDKIYIESMFWLPANTIMDRSKEDGIPYHKYVDQGVMRLSGDLMIDPNDVIDWFIEISRKYNIIPWRIAYDRWGLRLYIERFEKTFGKGTMDVIAQGAQTMSQPMQILKRELELNNVVYNDNPLLKLSMINTKVQGDTNGNIRPIKVDGDKRRRIDGFIAMLNAYISYLNNNDEFVRISTRVRKKK